LQDEKLLYTKDQFGTLTGLCKSNFLLFEYSVELRIEYSSTRLTPKIAINEMVQNKRTPGFCFRFVAQQRNEMSQNDASQILIKHTGSKVAKFTSEMKAQG